MSLRTTVRKNPPSAAASVTDATASIVSAKSPRRSGADATKRLNRIGKKLREKLAIVARVLVAYAWSKCAGISSVIHAGC